MSHLTAVHAQSLNVTVSSDFPRRTKKPILRDINFRAETGKITGLLGPSGSGKTTLMRAIVGVQDFDGVLNVLGQPAGTPVLRGKIGYVTQNASVYHDLSVVENLRYFGALARGAAAPRRPEEILDILNMADLAQRQVSTLSGGQRGRVSLGCALIASPELLVMDEPTVGLDPLTRQSLWEEFHTIARAGAGVIISSHVLEEAARCDDLILLRAGRVIWTGTPPALLSDTGQSTYEDAFLAALKPDINPAFNKEQP